MALLDFSAASTQSVNGNTYLIVCILLINTGEKKADHQPSLLTTSSLSHPAAHELQVTNFLKYQKSKIIICLIEKKKLCCANLIPKGWTQYCREQTHDVLSGLSSDPPQG